MDKVIYDTVRPIVDYEIHPTSSKILVALADETRPGESNELVWVNPDNGESHSLGRDPNLHLTEMDLSPYGDGIAYVNNKDAQVYYQDLGSSVRHQVSIPSLEEESSEWANRTGVTFTPDGSRILYCAQEYRQESIASTLYAAPLQGGELKLLYGGDWNDDEYIHYASPGGPARSKGNER